MVFRGSGISGFVEYKLHAEYDSGFPRALKQAVLFAEADTLGPLTHLKVQFC
jgi:hypothetical protein